MFQPSLAYILAEDIKYCQALRDVHGSKTIEDGHKVRVQTENSESNNTNDKYWIENECL